MNRSIRSLLRQSAYLYRGTNARLRIFYPESIVRSVTDSHRPARTILSERIHGGFIQQMTEDNLNRLRILTFRIAACSVSVLSGKEQISHFLRSRSAGRSKSSRQQRFYLRIYSRALRASSRSVSLMAYIRG